jgi:hypothetical protein
MHFIGHDRLKLYENGTWEVLAGACLREHDLERTIADSDCLVGRHPPSGWILCPIKKSFRHPFPTASWTRFKKMK